MLSHDLSKYFEKPAAQTEIRSMTDRVRVTRCGHFGPKNATILGYFPAKWRNFRLHIFDFLGNFLVTYGEKIW